MLTACRDGSKCVRECLGCLGLSHHENVKVKKQSNARPVEQPQRRQLVTDQVTFIEGVIDRDDFGRD